MQVFVDMMAMSIAGGVVAIAFWNQILYWVDETLFPWIQDNLPELEPFVRKVFSEVHKVVIPIRRSWEKFREYLLKVLVQFEQNAKEMWVRRIIYWVIRNLKFKLVVRTVAEEIVDFDSLVDYVRAEEIVDFDSLPDDVRQEWLKLGKTTQDISSLSDDELQGRYLKTKEVTRVAIEARELRNQAIDELEELEELEVLSNPTTQKSSVEIKHKSHIKGWVTNILPEECRGELEFLRYTWLKEDKGEFWIEIMTGFHLLTMFKAYLQVKIENIWLAKRKQN